MTSADSNANPSPLPSQELLAHYALGELLPPTSDDIENALRSSATLRQQLGTIRSTIGMLKAAELHDPPMRLVQEALRLVRASQASEGVAWFTRAADFIATLVFDSFSRNAAMGLRTAGLDDVRHLTFDSGITEIDVEISPSGPARVRFMGQVAVDGVDDGPIRVAYVSDAHQGEAGVDEIGRFSFEVPKGEWEIRVQVGAQVVALPRIVA